MKSDEAIKIIYTLLRYREQKPAVREALQMAVEALQREEDDLK